MKKFEIDNGFDSKFKNETINKFFCVVIQFIIYCTKSLLWLVQHVIHALCSMTVLIFQNLTS